MMLSRRRALAAGAATGFCLATPRLARAATATRRFAILRNGDDIGTHTVRLERDGDDLRVAIDVEIVVRVFGIAAYRYEMTNREVWRAGRLVSGDSRVNDDGDRKRVVTRREGDALIVDGSSYRGPAPADVATTTYFTQEFLTRPTWMSTDGGDLLSVTHARLGPTTVATPRGPVEATRWRVTDGAAYDVELDYDAGGEWIGLAFDAGGARARYRLERDDADFSAVWGA